MITNRDLVYSKGEELIGLCESVRQIDEKSGVKFDERSFAPQRVNSSASVVQKLQGGVEDFLEHTGKFCDLKFDLAKMRDSIQVYLKEAAYCALQKNDQKFPEQIEKVREAVRTLLNHRDKLEGGYCRMFPYPGLIKGAFDQFQQDVEFDLRMTNYSYDYINTLSYDLLALIASHLSHPKDLANWKATCRRVRNASRFVTF